MSSQIVIKSRFKNYNVDFIDDFSFHLLNSWDKKHILLIDFNIYKLYKKLFIPLTKKYRCVLIEASESNKSIDYSKKIIVQLLKINIKKNNTIIVVGGGISQDIGAFISSILFRGVDWVFYPTTLLAQADSCIGSKSSINFNSYKNLLGTFMPPKSIFISLEFLETLSEDEIKSGIGEMLHYYLTKGIIDSVNIMNEYKNLLTNRKLFKKFIFKSLLIKKEIIEVDELDTSLRHIFNYGHTFGHAIEAISNYSIPHGIAITLGMDIANFISYKEGLLKKEEFQKIHLIIKKNLPSFIINDDNILDYLNALRKDKKNKGDQLGCILCFKPGKVKKVFLEIDDSLAENILDYFNNE